MFNDACVFVDYTPLANAVIIFVNYEPYPQLRHKIKMAAIVGGLCTDSLWRGYCFAMNDIKKSKIFQVRHSYIQSFNANSRVLINLSIFWLVFIIPGELVSDDCIYASPERFLDFL